MSACETLGFVADLADAYAHARRAHWRRCCRAEAPR